MVMRWCVIMCDDVPFKALDACDVNIHDINIVYCGWLW